MEEFRVITNKGTDVAEIDQLLQKDTSGDSSVDSNIIPDRTCDVSHAKATNNRITCYMLEPEEAVKLKNDPRIKDVEPSSTDQAAEPFAVQNDQFQRTITDNQADKNWGLYRHLFQEWQANQAASSTFSGDYTYTLDGTGVDIVIQDDGVDPTGHPEWEDYNGTTRFQQIDWYAASGVSGTMPANHYTNITNDSNRAGAHGSHCCGIAAGKTYGWAKNAQLFSVRLFGGSAAMNMNDIYDVIREWHLRKPIDPNTGFRRPTIVNQSWGYSWYYSNNAGAQLQSIFFKGVDQNITPASFSSAFVNYGMVNSKHPTQNSFADTEQEMLTDAGIICVKAAGNAYHPCAYGVAGSGEYGSDIYNSYYTINQYHNGQGVAAGQPVYYNRPSSPHSTDTLWVANMDTTQYGSDEKVRVDSERGPRIDITAAGDDISSATSQTSIYGSKQLYPGSSTHYMAKIGGTSMAAPQITGMGALWLQANPGGTAQQFKDFLKNNANATLYDSGTAESFSYSNSYPRLYGAPNRVAHWPYSSPNPIRFRGTNGNDQ